jgi:hypothetical protein
MEWLHALGLGRPGFVRPTYWEVPCPTPPPELAEIHFQPLRGGAAASPPAPPAPAPTRPRIEGVGAGDAPRSKAWEDLVLGRRTVGGGSTSERFRVTRVGASEPPRPPSGIHVPPPPAPPSVPIAARRRSRVLSALVGWAILAAVVFFVVKACRG